MAIEPGRWTARVLTLFPEMFPGPLGHSLTGRALAEGLWGLEAVNIRDFATDRHRTVDDSPAGGGAGMVLRADVVAAAVDRAAKGTDRADWPVLYLSPRGRPFTQGRARALAAGRGVTLLCGRFEGVDERVLAARAIEEVSIGDFVLTGGEIAAFSTEEESFSSGLLEFPQYTRPTEWEGLRIPEVLLSGHHGRIAAWRRDQAERLTKERRPDLWRAYVAGRGPGATAGDPAGETELSDAQTIADQGEHQKDD